VHPRTLLVLILVVAALVAACGGKALSKDPASQGSSSGGNGGSSGANDANPQCDPRTAPVEGHAGLYNPSALPAGACTDDEPTCDLLVTTCPCGDYPVEAYTCACELGEWACRFAAQGPSTCACQGGTSGGSGGTKPCDYPPVQNDPRCPPQYSPQNATGPCPIGLTCSYPGVGDGASNGCNSTAVMFCHAPFGDSDGGADAGTGVWSFGQ